MMTLINFVQYNTLIKVYRIYTLYTYENFLPFWISGGVSVMLKIWLRLVQETDRLAISELGIKNVRLKRLKIP